MKTWPAKIFILVLALIFLVAFQVQPVEAVKPNFPRRANYFLHWQIDGATAKELSKWDLLVLDMETQVTSRTWLQKIREWNPNIKILAYITPQEIKTDAAVSGGVMRSKLVAGIPQSWYLANSRGLNLSWWPGTYVLNLTAETPKVNGLSWADYLVNFVSRDILSTGLWDGIFYDNAWSDVTTFVGSDVDTDRDGVVNQNVDNSWRSGMISLYRKTRQVIGPNYIIVGNGTTRLYRDELSGLMIENFSPDAWTPTMRTYAFNHNGNNKTTHNILNANTFNKGGKENYRAMRFGLSSALLEDGYYSFDFGDTNHGQTWWYDEYGVDLGQALGKSASLTGGDNYAPGVWKRDFEYGLAVVNSSGSRQQVDLGGEYEKIHGAQDKTVNSGEIVSELTLNSYDGQLLLKTLSSLNDVMYPNGSFVRFFHPDGRRARNGFFVFDAAAKGSDYVASVDLNADGRRDTVQLSGNKLSAKRDDGQTLFKVFPYTANYLGSMRGSLGDVNMDGKTDVIVSPASDSKKPIMAYNFEGQNILSGWQPLGNSLKGGLKVSMAEQRKEKFFVLGAAKGQEPYVYVYDKNKQLVKKWPAFELTFKGGVSVATGDINGDGVDEIIVGPGSGKKPIVKTFNLEGKSLYPEFTAYTALGLPGADVLTVDVDHDGVKEIAVVSKQI